MLLNTDHFPVCINNWRPRKLSSVCSIGFTALSTDIDECAEGKHYCRENTMCVNTPGSFMCICKTGYIRIDDYSCTGKSTLAVF